MNTMLYRKITFFDPKSFKNIYKKHHKIIMCQNSGSIIFFEWLVIFKMK